MQSILQTIKTLSDLDNLKAIFSAARPMLGRALMIAVGVFIGIYSVYLGLPGLGLKWRNAEPVHLTQGYKDQWVKNAAVIHANGGITQNPDEQAKQALESAGFGPNEIQALVDANPELAPALQGVKDLPSQATADSFRNKVNSSILANITPFFCLFGYFILFAIAGLLWSLFKTFFSRGPAAPYSEATQGLSEAERQRREALQFAKQQTSALDTSLGEPVAKFMSAYVLGDDLYDDSFAIEPGGGFAGECGIGISETIGVVDPKKVTAFEAWVFDQSEIQTLTYVLMSEHAYNDQGLRAKLAPRGEPMLVHKGQSITLETKTLRMQINIIDLEYGEGSLPPNSFFQKITYSLAVWQKEGAVTPGMPSPTPMPDFSPPPITQLPPQPAGGGMGQPLTGNMPPGQGQPPPGNFPPSQGQPLTGNVPPGQGQPGNFPPSQGQPLTGNFAPPPQQQPLPPTGGIRPLTGNMPGQQPPPLPTRQPPSQPPGGQSPAPGRAPLPDDHPQQGRRPPDDPFGDTSQM